MKNVQNTYWYVHVANSWTTRNILKLVLWYDNVERKPSNLISRIQCNTLTPPEEITVSGEKKDANKLDIVTDFILYAVQEQ